MAFIRDIVGFDIPDYKKIRVIIDTDADSRYIIEDLISKLELFCMQ